MKENDRRGMLAPNKTSQRRLQAIIFAIRFDIVPVLMQLDGKIKTHLPQPIQERYNEQHNASRKENYDNKITLSITRGRVPLLQHGWVYHK